MSPRQVLKHRSDRKYNNSKSKLEDTNKLLIVQAKKNRTPTFQIIGKVPKIKSMPIQTLNLPEILKFLKCNIHVAPLDQPAALRCYWFVVGKSQVKCFSFDNYSTASLWGFSSGGLACHSYHTESTTCQNSWRGQVPSHLWRWKIDATL